MKIIKILHKLIITLGLKIFLFFFNASQEQGLLINCQKIQNISCLRQSRRNMKVILLRTLYY